MAASSSNESFYSSVFYQAVERAFRPVERASEMDEHTATTEKRRVREKMRKAGQELWKAGSEATEAGGAQRDKLLRALARGALDRLTRTHLCWSQWLQKVDWVEPLVVLATEVWPGLGPEDDVRQATAIAVEAFWRDRDEGPPPEPPQPTGHRQGAAPQQPALPAPPGVGGRSALEAWLSPEVPPPPPAGPEPEGRPVVTPPPPPPLPPQSAQAGRVECDQKPSDSDDVRLIKVRIDRSPQEPLGLRLKGLYIQNVKAGSPCDGVLKEGDRLHEVNGIVMKRQDEFTELTKTTASSFFIKVFPAQPESSCLTSSSRAGPTPAGPPPRVQGALPAPPGASKVQVSTACSRTENGPTVGDIWPDADTRRSAGSQRRHRDETGSSRTAVGPAASGSRHASSSSPSGSAVVILNCEDIGRSRDRYVFNWEAVRKAVRHYEKAGYQPQGVCNQATLTHNPPPSAIADKLVPCPVIDGSRNEGRSSDRVFVLRLAQTYQCSFVDNCNYRSSAWQRHESWPWLSKGGHNLKIEYIFDVFGNYIPSSSPEPAR